MQLYTHKCILGMCKSKELNINSCLFYFLTWYLFFIQQGNTSAPSGDAVKKIFQDIEGLLDETVVKQIGFTYSFEIEDLADDPHGKWFLDLKNGAGQLLCEERESDCHFKMKSDVFLKMFRFEISSTQAFMEGKLKFTGAMIAAVKLESLMKKMRSKLWSHSVLQTFESKRAKVRSHPRRHIPEILCAPFLTNCQILTREENKMINETVTLFS